MTTLRGIATSLSIGIDGLAVSVSSVSRTSPPLCTSQSHGLATGDFVRWSCKRGMHQINGLLTQVRVVDANTFEALNIDASRWGVWSAGSAIKVQAWLPVVETVGYQFGSSSPITLDASKYFDQSERLVFGQLQNERVQITHRPQTKMLPAMAAIAKSSRSYEPLAWRILTHDGQVRFFAGVSSIPDESVGVGALATGGFVVLVNGRVQFGAATVVPPITTNLFSFEIGGNFFEMET